MPGMDLLETGPYKLLSMRRTDQRAESGFIRRCDVRTTVCRAGGGGKGSCSCMLWILLFYYLAL